MCKSFFHYFKKFDRFEVPISFRHKKEDTYTTWIGGLFSFLIISCALVFGIIYFIPFIKKQNYSLYYYTINLNKTEEINFKESKASFALGFQCSDNETQKFHDDRTIDDYVELQIKYYYYINNTNHNNTIKADPENIGFHNCTWSDFYYNFKLINSIDKDIFNKLKCFDDLDKVIKYRYQNRKEDHP